MNLTMMMKDMMRTTMISYMSLKMCIKGSSKALLTS